MAYLSKGSLEAGRSAAPFARSSNDGKTCERHDQKRTRKSDRAFCLTSASSTLFFGCALPNPRWFCRCAVDAKKRHIGAAGARIFGLNFWCPPNGDYLLCYTVPSMKL
jgi:hypothetical protein